MAMRDVVEQGMVIAMAMPLTLSRLSDLSGSEQILINESVSKQISNLSSVRSRCLGPMIRGRGNLHSLPRNGRMKFIQSLPARLMPSTFKKNDLKRLI
jgi:hypothetical protein